MTLTVYTSCSCKREGCIDVNASNYDDKAKNDDGSCIYPGCTDATAINYEPKANIDDGSCYYIPDTIARITYNI